MNIEVKSLDLELTNYITKKIKNKFSNIENYFRKNNRDLECKVTVVNNCLKVELDANGDIYRTMTYFKNLYFEDSLIVKDPIERLYRQLVEKLEYEEAKLARKEQIFDFINSNEFDANKNLLKRISSIEINKNKKESINSLDDIVNNIMYGLKKRTPNYKGDIRNRKPYDDRANANQKVLDQFNKIYKIFVKNMNNETIKTIFNLAKSIYIEAYEEIYSRYVTTKIELNELVSKYETEFKSLVSEIDVILEPKIKTR